MFFFLAKLQERRNRQNDLKASQKKWKERSQPCVSEVAGWRQFADCVGNVLVLELSVWLARGGLRNYTNKAH